MPLADLRIVHRFLEIVRRPCLFAPLSCGSAVLRLAYGRKSTYRTPTIHEPNLDLERRMLAVISPAKTLDFDSPAGTAVHTTADFLKDSDALVKQMKGLKSRDLSDLMGISEKLADLNVDRFAHYRKPTKPGPKAKQAVLAFKGDVYTGLEANALSEKELAFAQDHLRILSGLYGLLRPLDLIYPYRLEMGTKLKNTRGSNLYDFWGDKIVDALNQAIDGNRTLINLASNEYFNAVNRKRLDADVVTPVFKDWKNGKYKIISFFAKKARGAMVGHMVRNRIDDAEGLKTFDWEGYRFNKGASSGAELVFLRKVA
jgi:cytoplasmic iron level regulating protein YaaA (DUF328/UPF0246 family)